MFTKITNKGLVKQKTCNKDICFDYYVKPSSTGIELGIMKIVGRLIVHWTQNKRLFYLILNSFFYRSTDSRFTQIQAVITGNNVKHACSEKQFENKSKSR